MACEHEVKEATTQTTQLCSHNRFARIVGSLSSSVQLFVQLADLNEAKRSGLKKLDTLERVSTSASRSAQQYEAQIQGLQHHIRDAQAAARAAEADLAKVPCSCSSLPRQNQRVSIIIAENTTLQK
jgi:chromosome segregation ATPase